MFLASGNQGARNSFLFGSLPYRHDVPTHLYRHAEYRQRRPLSPCDVAGGWLRRVRSIRMHMRMRAGWTHGPRGKLHTSYGLGPGRRLLVYLSPVVLGCHHCDPPPPPLVSTILIRRTQLDAKNGHNGLARVRGGRCPARPDKPIWPIGRLITVTCSAYGMTALLILSIVWARLTTSHIVSTPLLNHEE